MAVRPHITGFLAGAGLIGALALAALAGSHLWPRVIDAESQASLKPVGPVTPAPGGASSFAEVISRITPAVVAIAGEGGVAAEPAPVSDPATAPSDSGAEASALEPGDEDRAPYGSGFLASADGYVATSIDALPRDGRPVVVLADGRRLAAEAVTSDPATGLALIKVPGEGFPFLNLRRNSTPRQGDWSVAVANPYGSGAVVAAGVVMGGSAALGDAFGDFLRIGADLGPAFSGAPVIDAQGRVIGVHTAPPGSAPSGRADVLAAPLTGALIDQLKTGRVDRGRLGLIAIDLTPNAGGTNPLDRRRGAVVAQLAHDSAAARAGLRAGDVIARLNGAEVRDAAALAQLILAVPTAAPLRLSVRRGERIFEATLSPAPALQAESAQNGKK